MDKSNKDVCANIQYAICGRVCVSCCCCKVFEATRPANAMQDTEHNRLGGDVGSGMSIGLWICELIWVRREDGEKWNEIRRVTHNN